MSSPWFLKQTKNEPVSGQTRLYMYLRHSQQCYLGQHPSRPIGHMEASRRQLQYSRGLIYIQILILNKLLFLRVRLRFVDAKIENQLQQEQNLVPVRGTISAMQPHCLRGDLHILIREIDKGSLTCAQADRGAQSEKFGMASPSIQADLPILNFKGRSCFPSGAHRLCI